MFYSHEILTSRQHGVATIWLMATLGSKSGHRKITRKAILNVNLPKACQTVTEPDKPLALRLQGSLLVGISRVYGQQCEYMLQDIGSLRTQMMKIVRDHNAQQTDPQLAISRRDHLNLPEDPAFNVDLDLGLDLSIFDFSTDVLRRTSLLSPPDQATSQSSLQIPDQQCGSQSSSPPFHPNPAHSLDPGFTQFQIAVADSSSNNDTGLRVAFNEPAIYDNVDMHVDDDGQLIFGSDPIDLPEVLTAHPGNIQVADTATPAAENVSEQQNQSQANDVHVLNTDRAGSDQSPQVQDIGVEEVGIEQAHDAATLEKSHDPGATTSAGASQKHARHSRPPQPDVDTQLSQAKLDIWEPNYLRNMDKSRQANVYSQSVAQAKRNASFWVLEQGICGVKVNFGSETVTHPLSVFCGRDLLAALEYGDLSRKRQRSDSESDDGSQSRRRRIQSLGSQQARHESEIVEDSLPMQDDMQPESEVGRQAEGSLKDHSSQMPWNVSSRYGSARPYGSALHGVSSVMGSAVGFEIGPPSSVFKHRSRLTSASPLFGKGRPLPTDDGFDQDNPSHFDYDTADFDNLDRNLAGDLGEDFEMYGPAAAVSTQQAAESQWLASALEIEGQNFLDFLTTSIHNRTTPDAGDIQGTITFHRLLHPEQNSQIVAAQALLHVLTLATKALIEIEQAEGFGDITMKLGGH